MRDKRAMQETQPQPSSEATASKGISMTHKKTPLPSRPRSNPALPHRPPDRPHHAPVDGEGDKRVFRAYPEERISRRPAPQATQKVYELMTKDVIAVDKSERLERVLDIMRKHDFTKLPVTANGRFVGVISDGEIVDELGSLHKAGMPTSALHASSVMLRDVPTTHVDADVMDLVELVKKEGFSLIPVLHNETLVGVLTKSDLLSLVTDTRPVSTIMRARLHAVVPTDRVVHARRLMLDHNVERLPVLDGGRLVGIMSEVDIAFGLARFRDRVSERHQRAQMESFLVEEVMQKAVVFGHPEIPIVDAARLMRDRQIGGLPLMTSETAHIAGMVTRTDLIRTIET